MSQVEPQHLQRKAYVYVRQSTMAQVERTTRVARASTSCATGRSRWAGPPTG